MQTLLGPWFEGCQRDVGRRLNGHGLTRRETQVIQLLADGKSTKEVAKILDLGVRTVENLRAKIKHKLGLRSTVDLVLYAIRHRIVSP